MKWPVPTGFSLGLGIMYTEVESTEGNTEESRDGAGLTADSKKSRDFWGIGLSLA